MRKCLFTCAAVAALGAHGATAETWSLDAGASTLAFGSVKSDYIGEVHRFHGLEGGVDEKGDATIEIDLATIDTMIDIRNERMIEHVFDFAPKAMIEGRIDLEALADLGEGETMVLPVEATLSFLGEEVYVTPDMFVARMSEDKVLVTTENLVFVATDELGIDAGIDALLEIAGLDGITRAVPVTMRLMFERNSPAS